MSKVRCEVKLSVTFMGHICCKWLERPLSSWLELMGMSGEKVRPRLTPRRWTRDHGYLHILKCVISLILLVKTKQVENWWLLRAEEEVFGLFTEVKVQIHTVKYHRINTSLFIQEVLDRESNIYIISILFLLMHYCCVWSRWSSVWTLLFKLTIK